MYYKIDNNETTYSNGKFLSTEITENGVTRKVNIINPTEQQMSDAGWQKYTEPELSEELLLANAKSDKINQINAYDKSTSVNEFTINGNPMWLNHELRLQVKTSVDAYVTMGQTEMTKVFNGMEFTFSCTSWLQMLAALEVYAAEALNTTERHKNAVMNMDNIQDVTDYDYTTGYPEKLEF